MAAKKSSSLLPVTVLRGHSRPVTALSFATISSVHKSLILSGDSEGHVKLWSLETSREELHQTEKAHSAGILSIERMNMNASQVVTSARDGLIKVWDMESFPKVISQISLSKEARGEGGHCFCNVSPLKSATYEDSCSPLICSSNSSGSEILLFDMRSQTSSLVLRFNLSDYVKEGDLLMNLLFRRTNTHCADQIIGAFDSGHMIAFDTRSTR